MVPTMKELFLMELEDEAPVTRRALEQVPEGKNDWKPHEKSMALGDLAYLVANMPAWFALVIDQNELDIAPKPGRPRPQAPSTNAELLQQFDASVDKAREALKKTTDAHLMTNWRMLFSGRVVSDRPRHHMLRTGVGNHLSHHRGQLTVYLRLLGEPVPAIYGPTADDKGFGVS
jgi:uncharacterized damage-inducible protein DinB